MKRLLALSESPAFKMAARMQALIHYYPAVEKMRALIPYPSAVENIIERQERVDRVLPYFLRPKINYPEIEEKKIKEEIYAINRKPGRPRRKKPKHIMEVVESKYIDLFQLVLRKAEIVSQLDKTITTQNKYRLWAFVSAAIDEGFFIDKSATVVGDLLQEYLGLTVTKLKQDIGFDDDRDKYRAIIKGCISVR